MLGGPSTGNRVGWHGDAKHKPTLGFLHVETNGVAATSGSGAQRSVSIKAAGGRLGNVGIRVGRHRSLS